MEEKACLECGVTIYGRSDKKFCSDNCRNMYNYRKNRTEINLVRQINQTLKRNRNILRDLNPKGKGKVHRYDLLQRGFNFNYFTNEYRTRKGTLYRFVYDQGYLQLDEEYFYLVERQEYVD